jgi:hypothetical protein
LSSAAIPIPDPPKVKSGSQLLNRTYTGINRKILDFRRIISTKEITCNQCDDCCKESKGYYCQTKEECCWMKRCVCKKWLRGNCKIFLKNGIIVDVTNIRKLTTKITQIRSR